MFKFGIKISKDSICVEKIYQSKLALILGKHWWKFRGSFLDWFWSKEIKVLLKYLWFDTIKELWNLLEQFVLRKG